jgi:ubiquinone/menaquinone biosynthesis C-methylase UbiE
MDYKINSQTYEILYARYLDPKRVYEMVDLAGDITGKRVADFCCGNGRLSRSVLYRKPRFLWAVDESKSMLDWTVPYKDHEFMQWRHNVDTALNYWSPLSIDIIFCQQAINYWFSSEHASLIKKLLAPNGRFIFNTFHNKPSTKPVCKSYQIKKHNYTEISWLVGNMVKHVQVCEGMDPHFTEFRWISPREFREPFKKLGFKISVKRFGGTDMYSLTKK